MFKDIVKEFAGKPTNYLEIGIFQGKTSLWMLENILTHQESRLYGIDPWEWIPQFHKKFPTFEDWTERVLNPIDTIKTKYDSKALFIKGYSQNVLRNPIFDGHFFDVINVDGHHTIMSVMRDFVLSWPLLKINGIMIFDDYIMKFSDEVKVTVDLILRALGTKEKTIWKRDKKCEILCIDKQVAIRKLRD